MNSIRSILLGACVVANVAMAQDNTPEPNNMPVDPGGPVRPTQQDENSSAVPPGATVVPSDPPPAPPPPRDESEWRRQRRHEMDRRHHHPNGDHHYARYGEWVPPTDFGISITLGGGIIDYFDTTAHQSVLLGPEWSARLNFGTRRYLGLEVAYIGATQRLSGRPARNQMLSNGFDAMLRLNLTTGAIQPFIAGGLGFRHYTMLNISSSDLDAVSLRSERDVGEVPAAAGIAFRHRGFVFDARFNVAIPFAGPTLGFLAPNPAGTTWGVNGNIGVEF